MPIQTADDIFGTAKWIVDPTLGSGTHTTIGAALTSASSGDTIFIRPGTYTENLTLKVGVNLTAFGCDSSLNATGTVIINGTCTLTAAGSVTISGIQLQTNSAALLAVTGTLASIVNLNNCYLNCSNSTGITFSSSSASAAININNCSGNLGTTGIGYFSDSSAGTLNIYNCDFANTGASTTASTKSAGALLARFSSLRFVLTYSSTDVTSSYIQCNTTTNAINTTAVTTSGTGTFTIDGGRIDSGTASAISAGVGTTVACRNCIVFSSNTNAITGAGSLTYGGVEFSSTSNTMNTTTQTAQTFRPGITRSAHQPCFLAVKTSSATNATGDGTAVTIAFDTTVYDQNSNFSGTNTFTAPVTGRYLLTTCVDLSNLGAGHTAGLVQIVTTAKTFVYRVNTANLRNSNNDCNLILSTVANMTAADTATVSITVANSTKTVTVGGSGSEDQTYFCGYLVC